MDKRKKIFTEINTNTLNDILKWLNPNKEAAEKKFDEILEKLEKYFEWNTLWDPSNCASRTIRKVWRNIKDDVGSPIENDSIESPEIFFLVAARKLQKGMDHEIFHSILEWLDSDEKKAAIIYYDIYKDLVDYFRKVKINKPEEFADKTFIRLSTIIESLDITYNKRNYIIGIARNIAFEYWRRKKDKKTISLISDIKDIDEQLYEMIQSNDSAADIEEECLRKCLSTFETEDEKNWTILREYLTTKTAKRIIQAKELKISRGALTGRIKRMRKKLNICADKCIDRLRRQIDE